MLQHLHAGDDVERAGVRLRVRLGRDQLVVHRQPALEQVQLGDLEGALRQIDAGDHRALARRGLGEDAAAAADVEHRLAGELRDAVDPRQAQRVDLVQRTEFAGRVPPAVRELAELLQLGRIGVQRTFHTSLG